jgi:hypothetical protein
MFRNIKYQYHYNLGTFLNRLMKFEFYGWYVMTVLAWRCCFGLLKFCICWCNSKLPQQDPDCHHINRKIQTSLIYLKIFLIFNNTDNPYSEILFPSSCQKYNSQRKCNIPITAITTIIQVILQIIIFKTSKQNIFDTCKWGFQWCH